MKTIHPTKDRYSRWTILWLWILMLAWVNGIFVLMFYRSPYILPYILWLCAIAWMYRRRRVTFGTLVYKVEWSKVSIHRNYKKVFEFDTWDIHSIDADYSLPVHRCRWWHVSSGGSEVIATKSRHDLVYIYLPEGRVVVMSDWESVLWDI